MLNVSRILVSTVARAFVLGGVTVTLAACGQKGNLFLPTEPAAVQRATLPESLRPGTPVAPAAATNPASPASAAR
ncbi:MAG TPA: lipoprotein [Burkholderiaceae bacterium]|nr:lipoprotein [Burkholderiaceae bacterium]